MPVYEWKGFDARGKKASGVIDADSPREARLKLKRDRKLVTGVTEVGKKKKSKAKGKKKAGKRSGPQKRADALRERIEAARGRQGGKQTQKRLDLVSTFTRQMATLVKAGIPITEALRAIIEQCENRPLEMVLRDVREAISQGKPTADALATHPDWFNELYVSMVRSGEAAGHLDEVLERLAKFIQEQTRVRNKVQAAMTYPIVMLVIGLGVVAILLVAVVPKITAMLAGRGQELPLPTQILDSASGFLVAYWWAIMMLIILASFSFNLYYSSAKGRLAIDSKLLRLPVFGDLIAKQAISRFAQTFATLLGSGVSVVRCLEVTRTVLGNRLLEKTIDDVREKILEGADIATPLKDSKVFPPLVGYMIAVGEQSGELDRMMEQVGESYQEEVDIATQKFTSLIEPLLIVFLAILVGFIILAILWPILQMSQSIG
ncbi:MAG: type II secretion system protein GspF [Planctomycetes bacterium]|nr:type II secretion system protein GspF [Planctomycetota bacterium]MBT4029700.1 type II secretion system protein GspF [Planctomycetota bacterium]MBT4561200.1 type II secretion system protein GspF [Planctomycetota bacterium]MBT5120525.1 type II secretion system protein GspF [Planctomycetota bacterium]MBT7319564.1 type II secretion system protein GspF [Planctomycetota bacterium]